MSRFISLVDKVKYLRNPKEIEVLINVTSNFSLSIRRKNRARAALLALTLAASPFWALASRANISVKNFGKVNENLYRGGQPSRDGFRELKNLGVRTVVDLRTGDRSEEAQEVGSLGMNYVNIPMDDSDRTYDPQVSKFLALVQDPNNGPVFVHCAGGRHRTGTVVAAYRMSVDGWDIGRSYQEMKDYDFYTAGGHGGYKTYVYDYYDRLERQHRGAPVSEKAIAATGAQR
ncbi:MAG TPA: tyrosine-protein phosphatase [Acidobacteriota bacterium]